MIELNIVFTEVLLPAFEKAESWLTGWVAGCLKAGSPCLDCVFVLFVFLLAWLLRAFFTTGYDG